MATTLLILRATTLLHHGGRSVAAATSLSVLIFAGHNACGSVTAIGGGHWLDRAGPRAVFASGAAAYVAAYSLFALPLHSPLVLVAAFLLAGAGIGLAETAGSALMGRLLPDHLRGSGFGLLGGVQSLGDFASSAVVGLLWTTVSPTAGFAYAAAWMGVCGLAALGSLTSQPASMEQRQHQERPEHGEE
jgi:MFS family permease